MVTKELLEYVAKRLDEKVPEEAIRRALLDAGWNIGDASDAVLKVKSERASAAALSTLSPITPGESRAVSGSRLAAQVLSREHTPQKSRGGRTVFAILLLFILLGGGGAGAYFYLWLPQQNTPAPAEISSQPTSTVESAMTDWKTYRNEQYGFEVKYRIDSVMSQEFGSYSGPGLASFYFYNPNIEPVEAPDFFVRVFQYTPKLSLESWLTENPETYDANPEVRYAVSEELEINGIKGILMSEPNDPVPHTVFATQKDKFIYIVGIYTAYKDTSESARAILSTFKFTK